MVIEVQDDVIMTEWWTSKEGIDGKSLVTNSIHVIDFLFTVAAWRRLGESLL